MERWRNGEMEKWRKGEKEKKRKGVMEGIQAPRYEGIEALLFVMRFGEGSNLFAESTGLWVSRRMEKFPPERTTPVRAGSNGAGG
jgi:hypothetical protein